MKNRRLSTIPQISLACHQNRFNKSIQKIRQTLEKEQFGKLKHGYIEAEDLGIALIRFKNGAYRVIKGTTNVSPITLEETLYLFGKKETVKADGQSVNVIEEWSFTDMLDDPTQIKGQLHESLPNVYVFGHIIYLLRRIPVKLPMVECSTLDFQDRFIDVEP